MNQLRTLKSFELLRLRSLPDAADRSSRPRGAAVHDGRRWRVGAPDGAAGLEDAAVAQEGIEDAGEAPGEGDDGDVLAAAGGEAQGPGPERLGVGRATAEDGDGGLDEEPARAAGADIGDGAAALRVTGAGLARDQAEVSLDLMRVAEALGIIQGGDEGGGGDRADGRPSLSCQ